MGRIEENQLNLLNHAGSVLIVIGFVSLAIFIIPRWNFIDNLYGPSAAVVFGWLLKVPKIYRTISKKNYFLAVIMYVIIFSGFSVLLENVSEANVLIFYAGLALLAIASREYNILTSSEKFKELSADTLFVVTAIMLLSLIYFHFGDKELTSGLVGSALAKSFSKFANLAPQWSFLQDITEFLGKNLQIEYYIYAIASLFWLSGEQTSSERFIPKSVPSITILLIGLIILVIGLYQLFSKGDAELSNVFIFVCLSALGAIIAYFGLQRFPE